MNQMKSFWLRWSFSSLKLTEKAARYIWRRERKEQYGQKGGFYYEATMRAAKLRQQFKKNNFKNYVYALIGKVIFSLMTVSLSLLLTFFIEVVEYKSLEKLTMGLWACGVYIIANLATSMFRRKYQNIYLRNATKRQQRHRSYDYERYE